MSVLETVLSRLDATCIIIFLVAFLIGYYWLTTPPNLPPGPPGFPVVGNFISVLRERANFLGLLKKWHQQYGNIITIRMGTKYLIVIRSYESNSYYTKDCKALEQHCINYQMMRNAFVKQGDVFSDRPSHLYSIRKDIEATGSGIVFSSGPTWKALRRLTLMTLKDFGVGKKSLEQRVQEEACAVVEVLDKVQGQPVCLKPLMAKFSSNIICSVILGNRFDYDDTTFIQLTEKSATAASLQTFFSPVNFIPLFRFIPAFDEVVKKFVSSMTDVNNFLDSILKDHEATYDPGEVRDFVDLYMKTRDETQDSRLYNASNMRRVIMDLLLAGTESTATTMDWIILYLVAYPEVQRQCQQEVDKLIGQERLATMENRKDLPYVMAVITETMRIAPVGTSTQNVEYREASPSSSNPSPANILSMSENEEWIPTPSGASGLSGPLILPHFTKTGGEVGGYTVPANAIVVANIDEIQSDPDVWPEPHVFKPERFLDKSGHFCQPKDSLVPFSIGPRVCPGESLARMEMFIFLVTLLQSFTFTMGQGEEPDLQGHVGITYSAKAQHLLATRRSANTTSE